MDSFTDEESLGADVVYKSASWKKPLIIIGTLFILLIMVLSIIPWFYIESNPPPNLEAVEDFKLTPAERASLEEVEYERTSNIRVAMDQVDVFDYRSIATRLVSSACSTHSDSCYAKAIYYFVQDYVQYVPDPEVQYVESPAEVLLVRGADCEGIAILTIALLEAVGIDADLGVTPTHAFLRAQVGSSLWGDEYVWLDPTSNSAFGDIEFSKSSVKGWLEL
jgi:hypothetical protein